MEEKNKEQNNMIAIIGFVVSLVSLLMCCGSFSFISLILSIVGLATVNKYVDGKKVFAIIGIVLSGIGMFMFMAALVIIPFLTVTENTEISGNRYPQESEYGWSYNDSPSNQL